MVEVDGATHGSPVELTSDRERDAALVAIGGRVYRVTNEDVRSNIDGVLEGLLVALESRKR